jgi:osmotically-inducible protein OsmY
MADVPPERNVLARFAGLALGIIIGGVLGPAFLLPFDIDPPAAASIGSITGAVAGYLLVSLAFYIQQRRDDAELQKAAESVLDEMGLRNALTVKVKNGRATLEGEAENYSRRYDAELAMSTIPGIKQVINRVRLRPSSVNVTASADEIRKRIAEQFTRRAELDAHAIRVEMVDSRIVLEGVVQSPAEASEAEEVAWNIPGVVQVENRLEVAA